MSRDDLVADFKRSLHDASSVFNAPADADWIRMLGVATVAMQDKRPRTMLGTVTITADAPVVTLPQTDFAQYKTHVWGTKQIKPWSPCYAGALPRVSAVNGSGGWQLVFDPPPTAQQLAAYGSTFRFWYFATHTLGTDAAQTTLALADRPLLLLRAQAEAMRELSMRNINKPVALRDGISGTPRNSTPAALYQQLLAEWQDAR